MAPIDGKVARMFGGRAHKLVMSMRIVTCGRFFDLVLPRFYNVKPKSRGGFTCGWSSALVREYSRLFGAPPRPDRLSMSAFDNVVIEARVKQVTRDRDGRRLAPSAQYSVVAELLKVKA